MNDTIIPATIAYIQDLFRGNSGGHDTAHSLRVYRNALRIAESEKGCDTEIVALAALLYDADDHKLFRTENNANARSFLTARKVAPEKIEHICEAINAVSFSQNRGKRLETLEDEIVQDADRPDALGAIGIARTFAYGGEHERSLDESVAHFHEKLLLLKDELNTEAARKLAEPRHAFLERFLEEYEKESNQT